jgi:minor extracellular serine protease Vpr
MDVINLSLDNAGGWVQSPRSSVASHMVERGIVVVEVGSDGGDKGLEQITEPDVGKSVISIASINNYEHRTYSILTDTSEKVDYLP